MIEDISLPERDLDLTHGVVLGDSVLVNNLISTEQYRYMTKNENPKSTSRTTVMSLTSWLDTGNVKVSLYIGL